MKPTSRPRFAWKPWMSVQNFMWINSTVVGIFSGGLGNIAIQPWLQTDGNTQSLTDKRVMAAATCFQIIQHCAPPVSVTLPKFEFKFSGFIFITGLCSLNLSLIILTHVKWGSLLSKYNLISRTFSPLKTSRHQFNGHYSLRDKTLNK